MSYVQIVYGVYAGVERVCRTLRGGGSKQKASLDKNTAKQQQERPPQEEEQEATGKEDDTGFGSGSDSDGSADDGLLNAFARFRGEEKECKFIIVTGE